MNWEQVFHRQVEAAKEAKEITPEQYRELISEFPESGESNNEFYHRMFQRLEGMHLDILFERVIKGAEYIESIGKDHPNYEKAMNKYDELCSRIERHKKTEVVTIFGNTHMQVYEAMRQVYNDSGRVMRNEEVKKQFAEMDDDMIKRGIREFHFQLEEAKKGIQE